MEQRLNAMMKRFPLFIAMGFSIVIVALVIGAINAGNTADYYAVAKATRDTSAAWAAVRAGVESTVIWLPYFKFFGVAMILTGITMALGVISQTLRRLGKEVVGSVPADARVALPTKPRSAMLMRLFMMLGMLVIVAGFIIALGVAGTASAVFSNTIVTIDGAATGSALLRDLAAVHQAEAWLEAFKFVGLALFFLGIVNGLGTIIFALRYQHTAIPAMVEKIPAALPVFAPAD